MARISPKQLEQFKQMFLAAFGEELSDADALRQATQLLELVSRIRKTRSTHA